MSMKMNEPHNIKGVISYKRSFGDLNDTHPSVEIDKVCTPGGMTIKGINELDHEGFDSAIIKAMKACLK